MALAIGSLLAGGLFLIGRFDFLLFHSLAETFSIAVACSIFMVAWNTRHSRDNSYFLLVGIAYLSAGMIDTFHMLSYKGMGVFSSGSANLPTQLWIAGRGVQSVSLFVAPWFAGRALNHRIALGIYAGVTGLLFAAIFPGKFFPTCFVEGTGLTPFKIYSEYAIMFLSVASLPALWMRRSLFDPDVLRLLFASILAATLGELAFTLYEKELYGFFNIAGHLLKIFSYYLLYKAVIGTDLVRKHERLIRELTLRAKETQRARQDLARNVELLERIFSNIHLCVVYLDTGFRFLRVNKAYADACGRPAEFFSGRNHFDLYPHAENEAIFRKVLATGEPCFVTGKPFVFPDRPELGVTYWDWSLQPVRGEDGGIEGLLFCLVDVTKRALVEKKLQELSRTLKGIIDASPVAIVLVDSDGILRMWNPSAERIFGWKEEEVLGRFPPSVPQEEREEVLRALAMSRQGKPVSNREARRMRKDGSLFDALISTAPLFDPDGRFVGTIGIVSDISDIKGIEAALRESEERFRSLVENSSVGICIVRGDRVVFRNPEQERMFGPFPESFGFRNFGEVHPEDRSKFDAFCDAVSSAGGPVAAADFRFFVRQAGSGEARMRWVHCRATPIDYRAGKSALVNMVDITRVKELEYMVQAREKMSALGHVAAGIAHEIRNPLSAINIHLATLDRVLHGVENLREEERNSIGAIVKQTHLASKKITSVVQRVMDFAKPTPPRLGRIDVNDVAREVSRISGTEMEERGIALETSLFPDPPACPADPHLLRQVLLNLIQNAAQAMEKTVDPKRIEIRTSFEEGRIVLRVSDSGPGVPPHLWDRIFDPFFTTRGDGHGIGLSFSHRVVSDHGGLLTVGTSRLGGAEFRVVLPVEREEVCR